MFGLESEDSASFGLLIIGKQIVEGTMAYDVSLVSSKYSLTKYRLEILG
jgi:hypothetical protein